MSFADSLKGMVDKAKSMAKENSDKVDQAVGKVGDTVNEKTEGKYSDKVDKAQDAIKKNLGVEDEGGQSGQGGAGEQGPGQGGQSGQGGQPGQGGPQG